MYSVTQQTFGPSSTLALAVLVILCPSSALSLCESGCSGHGACATDGACACDSLWAGHDCSFFLGATSDDDHLSLAEASVTTCAGGCSGNGRCVVGVCVCRKGFFGPTCADERCPQGCSGHGSCSEGQCFCSDGWDGRHCGLQVAPAALQKREAALIQASAPSSSLKSFQKAASAAK